MCARENGGISLTVPVVSLHFRASEAFDLPASVTHESAALSPVEKMRDSAENARGNIDKCAMAEYTLH